MARFLGKLFDIRAPEWPRVLLLFLVAGLTNMVEIWGSTIAYTGFLKQVGVGALPWILVSSSVLSILATAVYSAFADRISNDRMLIVLYLIEAACILGGAILLGLGLTTIAYPLIYLLDFAVMVVCVTHFSTYVNSFYDIQSAKRVVPLVFAGFRAGAIVAGLSMPLLTSHLTSEAIIVLWSVSTVLIAGLIWLAPRLLGQPKTASAQPLSARPSSVGQTRKQSASYWANLREGFHHIAQSAFLRWIAISTGMLMVLLALIEYRSTALFLEATTSSQQLANYLALLTGVGNMFVLPMLLFVISRIIGRLGLGNATMIYPVGNLIICGGLVFAPSVASASFAYLDRTALRITFQSSITNLLYNAVPVRIRARARAFVSGLVVPLGSLIGGVVLLIPVLVSSSWFVSMAIGLLAVAYLLGSLVIRQKYGQALIKLLQDEDFSFLLSYEASDLTVTDPATLAQLQKKLEASTNHELTVFIAQLIVRSGSNQSVPILEQAARDATDAHTRAALIDVVVASDLNSKSVADLYLGFFNDPAAEVRKAVVAGLEEFIDSSRPHLLLRLMPMFQDPDRGVQVRVLSAVCRTGYFYQVPPALTLLDQLLADQDSHWRATGVHLLGDISLKVPADDDRALRRLIDYLVDPADEVRLEAAVAIETLTQPIKKTERAGVLANRALDQLIVDKMGLLLKDPIERVRLAALVVLDRVNTPGAMQASIDALADRGAQVRATAVELLVQRGRATIPLVHPCLRSPDAQLRKMAAVILSRVSPREFGALVSETSITENLLTIYHNLSLVEALQVLSPYRSIGILQSALREQNRQLVEEIFYLLQALHAEATVTVIGDSLRSQEAYVRAEAREALESLIAPQTARLITPLFEPELLVSELLLLGHEAWSMEYPNTSQVLRQLATQPDEAILRMIAIFALGEIGAALTRPPDHPQPDQPVAPAPQPTPTDQSPAEGNRGRRRPALDRLSSLLDGIGEAEKPASSPPPAPPADATATSTPADAVTTSPLAGLEITRPDIEALLAAALTDPVEEVRAAAVGARRMIGALDVPVEFQVANAVRQGATLLSTIEKIIFLKQVPFFQGMTVEQLHSLAGVCEEEFYAVDTRLYQAGDPGGVLYVVVNGRVGIEQEKRKGSFARLSTIEAYSYFGEANLFDNSPRTTSAVAIQDTMTLQLRREPLIALARQYPELSLELINVLSQRLRETSNQVAELTRTRPRELHKLYDQFS